MLDKIYGKKDPNNLSIAIAKFNLGKIYRD